MRGNKNNKPNLARQYARCFVSKHYLFPEAHSAEPYCKLFASWNIQNPRENIRTYIFEPTGVYFLYNYFLYPILFYGNTNYNYCTIPDKVVVVFVFVCVEAVVSFALVDDVVVIVVVVVVVDCSCLQIKSLFVPHLSSRCH